MQRIAIEPIVLYQIMKRALEPRLSTLMGPLAAVLGKPSGQDEQTSQAQSPVVPASYCIKFTSIHGRNAETTTSNLYQADENHRNASAGSLNCNLAPKPTLVS